MAEKTASVSFDKEGIASLIGKMTLEEKASLCDGEDFWHLKSVERLGIPSIMVCDGPHGLRKQNPNREKIGISNSVPAICYPTAAATACSWDRELLYEMGEALGDECLKEKVSVLLGPGVNIKRSPLCGRNFEYFSEDPLLAGEMGAAFIRGVQSKGVGTSLKHFAANSQETRRMTVSSVVDERALREIYFPAFETAVKKGKPWTVMNAYNRLNGEYCSENEWLQNGVLRDEWGFDGLVVSDWGAVNDRAKGLKAGNDLEMPSSKGYGKQRIISAVESGELDERILDKSVETILRLIGKSVEAFGPEVRFDEAEHHALARRIAGQSAVLLKNEGGLLPLKKGMKIAVIGEMAKKPRYQGAGSSLINPTRLDNALDCLRQEGFETVYAAGYEKETAEPNDTLIAEAVSAAAGADAAVVFIGLTEDCESEGFDRAHMKLPDSHNALIEAVCAANTRTVTVLSGGAPVELPWLGKTGALLNAYLGGQAGAGAVADILSGNTNPGGKLAETYPLRLEDTPCRQNFPGNPATVEYRESIYVGYRYYDKIGKPVCFPFGFGLSYTSFEYSGLKLNKTSMKDNEELVVSFKVKNTGGADGAETVQCYITDKESTVFRAAKDLKGFEKVFLKAGEEKEVSISLSKRAFAYYNTLIHDWHVESGEFGILIGASSADIRLAGTVEVLSSNPEAPAPDYREKAPLYYTGQVAEVPDEQFEALLGYPLPPAFRDKSVPVGLTDNLENSAHTKWGGRLNRLVLFLMRRFNKGPNAGLMNAVAVQTPFRCMVAMSGGLFSPRMAEGLLRILNGDKAFKGLRMILGGVPRALIHLKSFLKTI